MVQFNGGSTSNTHTHVELLMFPPYPEGKTETQKPFKTTLNGHVRCSPSAFRLRGFTVPRRKASLLKIFLAKSPLNRGMTRNHRIPAEEKRYDGCRLSPKLARQKNSPALAVPLAAIAVGRVLVEVRISSLVQRHLCGDCEGFLHASL